MPNVETDLSLVFTPLDTPKTDEYPGPFPNVLSQFVYTRTYSRWRYDLGRRETWDETVDRYIEFISTERQLPAHIVVEIKAAIMKMEILPSMRALWSAGEAARRDNTCLYNCAFIPLDSLRSFSELLYILMMGTGIGYSVEREFVNNLPIVAPRSGKIIPYVIPDSTTGWADSFFFGLQEWFQGNEVDFDYSLIRSAGAPLRIKGGRASGPAPLRRLLEFAQKKVLAAAGRGLRSIEAHDIACMVGEIVMSGGVRRAALICISDIDDAEMRDAKKFPTCRVPNCEDNFDPHLVELVGDASKGHLWTAHGLTAEQYLEEYPGAYLGFPELRYMANNSANYPGKPGREVFDREWAALVASYSGERGIFSMPPAKRAIRRGDCRPNPCVTGDTRVMTSRGLVQIRDLVGSPFNVAVDRRFNTVILQQATTLKGAFKTGTKEVFSLQTAEGYQVRLTADHRVMTADGWKEAQHLSPGDILHISNTEGLFGTRGSADAGMVAGWVTGDGCLAGDTDIPRLYFYGDDRHLVPVFLDATERLTGHRPNVSPREEDGRDREFFQSPHLREYLGQVIEDKFRTPEFVWQGTEECQQAYLSALFSADGGVQGTREKGISVRLASFKLDLLHDIQTLLLNFGIASRIYEERRPAGYRDLPDGKGGYKTYFCNADHELVVSKTNLLRFHERIGFIHEAKQAKLAEEIEGRTALIGVVGSSGRTGRGFYRETFTARFKELVSCGTEDVYDMTVPETHSFHANGLVVHNCGEILLRYLQALADALAKISGEGGGGGFCNLSAAVMRADDTIESFANKIRLAAWIGAIQATFTYFPYLRPGWTQIAEEDRLLGVDITGQCDNPGLSNNAEAMLYFNQVALDTAAEASAYLGTNLPAAVTCGKPSGNSSQLVDCSSGFHARFAPYYIRRVRIAGTDPLFKLVRDAGLTVSKDNQFTEFADEDCPTWVVDFPVKAPKNAVFRDDETAVEMLERYLLVMRTWCGKRGHNQSTTIYVKPEEWDEVRDFVFEHFDEITGISFLPFDGGKYKLSPYEEITEEQYDELVLAMPDIDFADLTRYEHEDRGEGAVELACSGGSCEIDYDKMAMQAARVDGGEVEKL